MSLRALLTSEDLLAFVGNVDALPTVPKAYLKLLDCLRDPLATIENLAAIIRQDVAMTAKVVMLANSGFFGIREQVRTVERAVSFVGMEAISTLVLGQELFGNSGTITLPGFDLERLSRHSFETGAWARAIALYESLGRTLADTAFLAGVLHDVGQLIVATRPAPAQGQKPLEWCTQGTALMKAHHAAVGAYLLGLWGFPVPIVEAIVWHQTPSRCNEARLGLCGVLHVGNLLAHEREQHTDESCPQVEPGYLEALGLADRWSDWRATRPAPHPGHASIN
jgi:HD-like signal output (HDOD) protein